jgi:hypothetical protein
MPPFVRYFNEENARQFLQGGEVLFRALSYFRDYEDDGVRSDPFEGTLAHRPMDGLRVKLTKTGQEVEMPYTLESTAREDDIFVYCMSTAVSREIGQRFGAQVAVEIIRPQEFLARVRSALALRRRLRPEKLVHQEVRYYQQHEPPIVDWALPERIALRKPLSFSWQQEYRLAVPLGDAFAVENVQVKLVPLGAARPPRAQAHPKILLKLGRLANICRSHTL